MVRIDPSTNRPGKPIRVGDRPQGVASSHGKLLVAVRQSGAQHRGGTLVLRERRSPQALDSIDPAVSYIPNSWAILHTTGDGLVGYNQTSGVAATQLVPDLAVSLPSPTDGGRTYAFTLRRGIRYSNSRSVKASDFRATIERDFRVGSPVSYYDGIVGGARCRAKPKRCSLARGIVADDTARTVTFHLVEPNPEFLYKLALPFAFAVPAGSPPHDIGTHALPETGPYAIAAYEPKRLLKLVRNPYFREWSQAAQPDGYPDTIVLRASGTVQGAIADVVHGKADVLWVNRLSLDQLTALSTQHASLVHTAPTPTTTGLFLNSRVAPFDRLAVRKALNYAIDRSAGVRTFGGPVAARPTCQILPPDFPGYKPYCPYTVAPSSQGVWTAPDLAKARALVAGSGTRGMRVTVWSWSPYPGVGAVAARALRELGYRASVKTLPLRANYFGIVGDSRTRAQIGFAGWLADYPAPSAFFSPNFACGSFVPASAVNANTSEFCDRRIDRQLQQGSRLEAAASSEALGLSERIDRELTNEAPWAPLYTPNSVNVLSKRVGNYQYSPAGFGMLLDQLWVR